MMNLSCLRVAVKEVAWGEWPFAPLVGGMSPRMADWWQSLAQPGMPVEKECLLPPGVCSPWPFTLLFPDCSGHLEIIPGLWAPGAGSWACCFLCFQQQQWKVVCQVWCPGTYPVAPHLAELHVSALLPGGP